MKVTAWQQQQQQQQDKDNKRGAVSRVLRIWVVLSRWIVPS
jgi:hypothetical protein